MLLNTQITMPNQDPMAGQEFSLAPRNVRKWIKALPYIDQNVAAQQFYDGLRRSNRQAHPTKQRLAAIELMRPVAREFLKEQRKYLISQPFPLSKKAAEVLKLQQNIISELAVAYKIIIQETANRDIQLSPKKLIVCIHHAMRYMLEQYITLALVYSEPPQGFWQDYCQLYKMAELIDLSHHPVKNESHLDNAKSTVNCLFKNTCLLSLANLHTFGHGEAEKIAAFLESTHHLTNFSETKYENINNEVHFINLALNKPPRLLTVEDIPISSENRYLEAKSLISELEKIIANNNNSTETILSNSRLNTSLAKRLLNKLTSKPKRANKRAISSKERLSVVHGLRETINTLLNNDADETETKPIPTTNDLDLLPLEHDQMHISKQRNSLFTDNIETDKGADAWDWVGRGNIITGSHIDATHKPQEKNKTNPVKIKPFIQSWEISNASNGGYCLKSENTSDYHSQVGDIILLRRENYPNEPWRIGIVRWMQSLSERGVKIGIETLHGHIQLARVVDAHFSSNKFKGLDHILYFTEESVIENAESLIAPPNSIKTDESLEIQIGGNKQTVAIKNIIERTISFVRFTFFIQQP